MQALLGCLNMLIAKMKSANFYVNDTDKCLHCDISHLFSRMETVLLILKLYVVSEKKSMFWILKWADVL